MATVLIEARRLERPEPPARTWPPLEPLKVYYIRGLRAGLLKRFKKLAIDLEKKPVEVINLIIEAGLDKLEADKRD
jgi:hypothetical protein